MSEPADIGPFLATAVLSQQAAFNEEGTLVGLSEITRHLRVDGQGPEATEQMPELAVKIKAVVVLVAGAGRGRPYTLAIQPEDPSGKRLMRGDFPFEFADHEQAVAHIAIDLELQIAEEGPYWIDVILAPSAEPEEVLLTRMPLQVSYHRSGTEE
jgi:hypothetical protein